MGSRVLTRILLLAGSLVGTVLFPVSSEATSACLTQHGPVYLSGFPMDAGSLFYASAEGSPAPATARIRVSAGCFHQGEQVTVRAHYTADPGTAGASDFTYPPGPTQDICSDIDGVPEACGPTTAPERSVDFQLTGADGPEAGVEAFTFRLTGREVVSSSGSLSPDQVRPPSAVPVYVIDGEGAPRASFEPGVGYSRSESYPKIRIAVFLAGPTALSVGYSITPSGPAPATLGEDYTVLSPNPVPVDPNTRVGWIELGIVNDRIGEAPESVTIAIAPGGGIVADNPASTTFTIQDNEESERPSSRFHHPRDNWRYKKSDYRIREVHVFATDTGGAGVIGSQLALRRNMKSGDCVWLTKEGWQKKDCSNRQWLAMTYDETGNLFYYRLSQLKSSVRTKIVDYTAFSRAIDGAENVEANFDEKRNANSFEIKRTRRRRH